MKRKIVINAGRGSFTVRGEKPLVMGDVGGYEIVLSAASDLGGAVFSISAKRPDGAVITDMGEIRGGIGYYTIIHNMYSVAGEVSMLLSVAKDGALLTDVQLLVDVVEGHAAVDIAGDERVPILTGLIVAAQETVSRADTAVSAAQGVVGLGSELQGTMDTHIADRANPHGATKAQLGLGNVDNTSDANKPVSAAQNTAINAVKTGVNTHTADRANPHGVEVEQLLIREPNGSIRLGHDAASNQGGVAIGIDSYAEKGGAVGPDASARFGGGAVGYRASSMGGGAVGAGASAEDGGAVGEGAYAYEGGAVGRGAQAGRGFAGGYGARAIAFDGSNILIDAIQLGEGTNTIGHTLQVYGYQMMDANGNIPSERVPDITRLDQEISDLAAYVVYTDSDIYGLEADFVNKKFTRLAGAIGKTAGAGFDSVGCFGGRKRCNVTDAGEILAYFGEAGYTETGRLEMELSTGSGEDAVIYPMGTPVQVMVYQPRFYYKVVPVELEPIKDGIGYHLRKARYYVSDRKRAGFKLHPAFIRNGTERPYVLLGAYEACIYDKSEERYVLDFEAEGFNVDIAADMLSSVSHAKPAAFYNRNLQLCKLSVSRGIGWTMQFPAVVACTQLLFLIEYGGFNAQAMIGQGTTALTGAIYNAAVTGATSDLGNASGTAPNEKGRNSVSYRGEENVWGNLAQNMTGINYRPAVDGRFYYITDHDFTENKIDGWYQKVGFTLPASDGFISCFGYDPRCDWVFFPSETLGNSSLPVGDHANQNANSSSWLATLIGGNFGGASENQGLFCYINTFTINAYYQSGGSRIVYTPQPIEEVLK